MHFRSPKILSLQWIKIHLWNNFFEKKPFFFLPILKRKKCITIVTESPAAIPFLGRPSTVEIVLPPVWFYSATEPTTWNVERPNRSKDCQYITVYPAYLIWTWHKHLKSREKKNLTFWALIDWISACSRFAASSLLCFCFKSSTWLSCFFLSSKICSCNDIV